MPANLKPFQLDNAQIYPDRNLIISKRTNELIVVTGDSYEGSIKLISFNK